MWHAEILKSGKGADCRSHEIIGDEAERADNGNHFAAMAHARVNATAVRIKTADDHVVEPDERSEHAHRRDEPERSVTGNSKGETDDVGFARAPVTVKNGGGARNIDVARALDVSWDQLFLINEAVSRDECLTSAGVDFPRHPLPLMLPTELAVGLEPLNTLY